MAGLSIPSGKSILRFALMTMATVVVMKLAGRFVPQLKGLPLGIGELF